MIVEDIQTQSLFSAWYKLRQTLEYTEDPLNLVADFFDQLPKVKLYTDPYNSDTWPTPWELISENEYCPFNQILGICYTIQLTERFKKCHPKINVAIDLINKTVYYLLFIEDKVYGYDEGWIDVSKIPKSLKTQKNYDMKALH
jgi:hypothetical protein